MRSASSAVDRASAGPDALALYADVPLRGEDFSTVAEFEVAAGERVSFELVYFPSYEQQPGPSDVLAALRRSTPAGASGRARAATRGPGARR